MLKITISSPFGGAFSRWNKTGNVGAFTYNNRRATPNALPYTRRNAKIGGVIIFSVLTIMGAVFTGLAGNSSYNYPTSQTTSVTVGIGLFNYTNAYVSDEINPEIRGLSYEKFVSNISSLGSGAKLNLVNEARNKLEAATTTGTPEEIVIASARFDFVEKMVVAAEERITVIIALSVACVSIIGLIIVLVFLFKKSGGKNKNFDNDTMEPMY